MPRSPPKPGCPHHHDATLTSLITKPQALKVISEATRFHEGTKRCQYLLSAWEESVAPHKAPDPSSPSATSCIIEGAMALFSTIIVFTGLTLHRNPLSDIASPLASAWPTLWPWFRITLSIALRQRDTWNKTGEVPYWDLQTRVQGVIQLYTILGPSSDLYKVFVDTPDMMGMIAEIWVQEIKGINRLYDFRASILPQYFAVELDPTHVLTKEIVKLCGGNLEEAADLIFRRMKANLRMAQPELDDLSRDVAYMAAHTLDPTSPLHAYFSPVPLDCMMLLSQIVSYALSRVRLDPSVRCHALCVCIQLMIPATPQYITTLESLGCDLLSSLWRASFAIFYGTDDVKDLFRHKTEILLTQRLPRLLIYRPVLCAVRRHLQMIPPHGRPSPDVIFMDHFKRFRSTVDIVWERYEDHHNHPTLSFACSNPECHATEDICKPFLRCASCALARYCDEPCQRSHWKSTHGTLCKNMHMQKCAEGLVLTTLSDPNLRFLGHMVASDFFEHIERISQMSKEAEPNSMLVFNHTHLDPVGPGLYYDLKISMVEEIETAIPLYRGPDNAHLLEHWQQAVRNERCRPSSGITIPVAIILPQASPGSAQAHLMTASLTIPQLSDISFSFSNAGPLSSILDAAECKINWLQYTPIRLAKKLVDAMADAGL